MAERETQILFRTNKRDSNDNYQKFNDFDDENRFQQNRNRNGNNREFIFRHRIIIVIIFNKPTQCYIVQFNADLTKLDI